MTLSAAEKAALRTGNGRFQVYASIGQYQTLLAAEVDAALPRGSTSITYTNGVGDISSVIDGYTLVVGERVVRVKAATPTDITVAANALDWPANQHIQLIDELRLWPKINRIYPKDSSGIFLKDFSETFTDAVPEPVPVFDHQAGFVPYSFTVDLTQSAIIDSTAVLGSTSLTGPAGLTIVDNSDNTYLVTVATAGQYWLKATVTDDLGQSQDSYRRVFGHSRDRGSAHYPLSDLAVNLLTRDRRSGGMQLDCTMYQQSNLIRPYALIVLWTEPALVGGPVLFTGYVHPMSIEHTWDTGQVRFTAKSIDQFLNQLAINDISLEAVASPAAWYQFGADLTTGRAIYHILKYHSNFFQIAHTVGLETDTIKRKYAEVPAGSLYGMANYLAQQRLARLTTDRQGHLHLVENPQMLSDADRATLPVQLDLQSGDMVGKRTIRVNQPQLADAYVTGFYYDGSEHEVYCAQAPMQDIFELGQGHGNLPNVILESPGQAAVIAGRLLAEGNMPYPSVSLEFPSWWANVFDVAPAYWVTLDIAQTETPYGLVWTAKKMAVERVMLSFDHSRQTLRVSVQFEVEADGQNGILISCDTGYSIPFSSPGFEGWPDDERVGVSGSLAIALFGANGAYLRELTASSWDQRDSGVTSINCQHGLVDPFWWTIYGNATYDIEQSILWRGNSLHHRSLDGGKVWAVATPTTDPPNPWSDSPALVRSDLTLVTLCADFFVPGHFMALVRGLTGSGLYRGWILDTANHGLSWTWINVSTSTSASFYPIWAMISQGTGAYLWVTAWQDGTLVLQRYPIGGGLLVEVSLGAASQFQFDNRSLFAIPWAPLGDDDLIYVGGRMDSPAGLTGVQHLIKSTDGGSSFTSVDSSWGTGVMRALYVGADDGAGNRKLYGVRQDG